MTEPRYTESERRAIAEWGWSSHRPPVKRKPEGDMFRTVGKCVIIVAVAIGCIVFTHVVVSMLLLGAIGGAYAGLGEYSKKHNPKS